LTIPYTVEPRPDTGVNNVKLGVLLFLATQAMLFGAWFSAYFMLRAGAITWGWSPHRELAQVNTVFLLAATGACTLAVRSARARRVAWFRTWMLMSIVLTLGFLGIRLYEYADDFALGLYPRESTRIGLYYLLTGVHALHVVGGMVVSVWLLATGTSTWTRAAPAIVNRVEATALYWLFVAAIWLCLLVLLYVW
jgi:heme/copper-type cytochrome/quinol oxidase subunit 3